MYNDTVRIKMLTMGLQSKKQKLKREYSILLSTKVHYTLIFNSGYSPFMHIYIFYPTFLIFIKRKKNLLHTLLSISDILKEGILVIF